MRRWIKLIGRGGTTLIAVGCAPLLVLLSPPAHEFYEVASIPIMGRTWMSPYSRSLTPQEELSVSIITNGTIRVYLLEVSVFDIYEWIISMEPAVDPREIRQEEYLLEYLEENSHVKVAEKISVNGEITLEYVPTKITNITLILHNPNLDPIEFRIKGSISRTIAPKSRIIPVSQIVIPLGLTLTAPWIIVSLQNQKRKRQV